MKKTFILVSILTAGLFTFACGNNTNAQNADTSSQQAFEASDSDYVTHEFSKFSISVPREFSTSSDESSEIVRFSSDAIHTLDDGTEFSSSAYIDVSFMSDGATPGQLRETATNMKLSEEAKGETCDEPVIEDNVVTMRTYHDDDDGNQVVTWRWWIVSEGGNNVAGNIYYSSKEAKFYESVVMPIVKSIKIK